MADATVSPTGKPVIPPKVVPWLTGLLGAAGVLVQVIPSHTVAFKVAAWLVSLGGMLGTLSPGARKQP
jgi:hypothetical protein